VRLPYICALACAVVLATLAGQCTAAKAATGVPSFAIDNAKADEATGQICFPVRKIGKTNQLHSQVTFYTIAGTAKDVVDFAPQRVLLVFAPTEAMKSVCVALTNDQVPEPTETFTAKLLVVSNARLYDGTATGTITDTDVVQPPAPPPPPPAPVFTCQDVSVTESAGVARVTCSKTGTNGLASVVSFVSSGGMPSAAAGVDYQVVTGTLTVAADAAGFTFDVPIIDDTAVEGNETFGTTVTAVSNATIGRNAQVLIVDDDVAPPPPPPASPTGWIARALAPLNTLDYFRTTSVCRLYGSGSVPAGTVFKTTRGDWAWEVDIDGKPAGAGVFVQRGWQVDSSGNVPANAPFVSVDRSCVEGVTRAP
jgi:hypothetical protein